MYIIFSKKHFPYASLAVIGFIQSCMSAFVIFKTSLYLISTDDMMELWKCRKRGPYDSSHDADSENTETQPSTKTLDLQYKMRPISLQHYLFLEPLFLVVNENNGKPTYKYSLVRNQSQAFWSLGTIWLAIILSDLYSR